MPTAVSLRSDGATLWPIAPSEDVRGALVPIEFATLPFHPRRVFVITDVPPGTTRGGHAHARGQQLLICVAGAVRVELGNSAAPETVTLDRADRGLLLEASVWAAQTYEEAGTVLLVLASEPFADVSYLEDPPADD